MYDRGGFML